MMIVYKKIRLSHAAVAAALIVMGITLWEAWPRLAWEDRRPVGALFVASYAHRSARNPRGWLNARELDVVGPGGAERFHKELFAYAGRAIAVLQAAHAQGMIVWDLEGEEFPQKTSYIGDPRTLGRLAPEMAAVADEFFARFRAAGLRTGMTVRPQRLVLDGTPHQENVWEPRELLLAKIDYARKRWGATLFYIDSNGGWLRPGELITLSEVARARPDVLLIPEHHEPLYYAFSAPYSEIRAGGGATWSLARLLYPHAFQVLNVADGAGEKGAIEAGFRNRDVLLFPGWFWPEESRVVRSLSEP